MSDYQIRVARESENRAALDMFRSTLLSPPVSDEDWPRAARSFQPDRMVAAFEGADPIGIARSVDSAMVVPGGAQVRLGAVTGIGVRSDRTRRGVATGVITAQLADIAERGLPLAALHASEATIYGRFGYGIATHERTFTVNRQRARLRAPVESGRIELHDLAAAVRMMPEIYDGFAASRTGMIARPSYLWPGWQGFYERAKDQVVRLAVYHGVDGIEGYASYRVESPWPAPGDTVLYVEDMFAGTDEAFRGLWQYVLSVDLVDQVKAVARPIDDPVDAMLVDSRACSTEYLGDDIWLRLVDVLAALRARGYAGEGTVVLDVRDGVMPANSGRYRVAAAGVERTDEPAGLALDVDVLSMLYLGGWRPSALARAGRIAVADPSALAAADALFATDRAPWCGTFF